MAVGPGQSLPPISTPQPIVNSKIPPEGPAALSYAANFGAGSGQAASWLIDLTTTIASKQISYIQACWIDNSANASPVTIAVQGTPFQITLAAHEQGFFPMLVPTVPRFNASSAGTAVVVFMFVNVPIPANTWASQ